MLMAMTDCELPGRYLWFQRRARKETVRYFPGAYLFLYLAKAARDMKRYSGIQLARVRKGIDLVLDTGPGKWEI